MKNSILLLIVIFLLIGCASKNSTKIDEVSFSYSILEGLEPENGTCRRDPSDVILVDGVYYLWYTKTDKQYSGYDASIWYAVSKDGEIWEEKGEAIGRGEKDSWDEYSVFTPNILKASGKYYLFYTGVKPTPGNPDRKFENNAETDITAIGLTVADSPDGPFERVSPEPVLEISDLPDDFDSYRIDDACIIYKDKQYRMYYKGRSIKHGKEGPRNTKMGVAIAKNPEGPYAKYKNNPIITSGHEVMVWPYNNGVMALISEHGPEGKTLQFASDGLRFNRIASFDADYPKAPGSYRQGNFTDASMQEKGIDWGVSMDYGNKEKWPHLLKYTMSLKTSEVK